MIISIDAEIAFHKIQYSFMIKALMKLGIEGNVPQHICQLYSQYHTKWGKTKTISSKVRNDTRMSTLSPLLFNIVLEILARAIKQEGEIKGIQVRKEEVKLSLFADDMILYLKDPETSAEKLLDITNNFSKVVDTKSIYKTQ
jgi:hypothetical protein